MDVACVTVFVVDYTAVVYSRLQIPPEGAAAVSAISLTTMGYGDIYPVTTAGRVVTMISSVFGIAIVALPAGIITAGYMNTLNEQ